MIPGEPTDGDEEIQVKGLRFLLGPEEKRNIDRFRGVRIEAVSGWFGPGFAVIPTYGACC